MMRIALFLATNVAVLVVMSIVLRVPASTRRWPPRAAWARC